ncbi:LysR family transcriptional regulator [Planotetraspora phitsanulokensis]|uniref:LysR family transcriptional regulator n=1 Tax=Planotetraspora phitsanulokensis TaxID=575192 RepID=A0A8J3XM04_9ACTN|nr:LysR family transcriptional regulator [Planotetraspora phitsanulokensis]GII41238.1 LysR family transcriptional regulator [Planotetraspora phitsanulokensis]
MELRHLAAFIAVAEEGGFTRAGERLHLVQSAVSAAVRNLERELGVTLFERTTHMVELTDTGRLLLAEARRTLSAAEAMRGVVDQLSGGLRGTVRLGVMQSQRPPWVSVPRLLAGFREEYPGVNVELRCGASAEHARDLREGRLDLAFVALPAGAARTLTLTPIASQVMRLVCPREHWAAGRDDVELHELADEAFADSPVNWGSRIVVDRAFEAAGVERKVHYEVGDMSSIVDFVHYGLAVAVLPPSVVDEAADVCLVSISEHAPVFATSIAAPADRELTPAALALFEAIRTTAAAERRDRALLPSAPGGGHPDHVHPGRAHEPAGSSGRPVDSRSHQV